MAQYIRTPCVPDFQQVLQVTQCSYHEERVFEIFWDQEHNRVLVQEFNEHFLLHSPDIQNLTVHNVLEALGYADEQIVVTWTSDDQNDALLNSTVENAALSQLSIYAANQPIPQNPYQGPLPAIAGQPIPAANAQPEPDFGPFQGADVPDVVNDHDDDQSTLSEFSDMPNIRHVDHFGDSDDERPYE
jgi:hypothetical protein